MQICVPASQEAADLVPIDKECDEFAAIRVPVNNDVCDRLLPFPDVVDLLVPNLELGDRNVLELDLLVQHPHRSVESTLHVVFDIVRANPESVEERGVLSR